MASKKPCPGCGNINPYRKQNEVCGECRDLMHDGRLFRALNLDEHPAELIRMPGVSHMLPSYEHEFNASFYDLVVTICNEVDSAHHHSAIPPCSGTVGSGWGHKYYGAKKGTAAALSRIYAAVVELSAKQMAAGRKQGRDLLSGLASGEISTADFDRR